MNTEESEFKKYWGIIAKNKWLILGATIFCMAVTMIISFILPPVYESSLIMEMGELYPPPEENIKHVVEIIEEPMSAVEILKSRDFLEAARRELGLKFPLKKMEARLEVVQVVELTRFQRTESPLVKLAYKDTSPELTVQVPNALARKLISQHAKEYESSIKILEDRIDNMEDLITVEKKLINREEEYQKDVKKEIGLVQQSIVGYEKQLNQLDFTETQRVEMLFLKSTLNNMKEQVIKLQKEFNDANLVIGEAEEKIQKARDQIANFQGFISLTKNTSIRTKPVLPEEPIGPRKLLKALVAGGLALFLSVFFVLFREYLTS